MEKNCPGIQKLVQPKTKGSITQKLSAVSSSLRDHHLRQVIAEMLNNHKKVVVVYGAGYYETLYKMMVSPKE